MHAFALLALAGAAVAVPSTTGGTAVTSAVAPNESTPAGCSTTYSGSFNIAVVNVTTTPKRSVEKRKALTVTLANGVLTDDEGRTGYIASNNQFQFDKPAQAGAIYTAGWSVCSNNTLALGNSAIFYQCLSGTFYNLYDENVSAQCSPVYIDVVGTGSSAAVSSVAASQVSDGQVQATTKAATVSQISDGQIQATTSVPRVSQISDGQIQATTGRPVVSQISDGQIQATANGTRATSSPTVQAFTGAAALPTLRAELFGLAAGVLALAAL